MTDPHDAAPTPGSREEPPFRVAVVPVTPFQQNASIVWESATLRAAVVDPGGDVEVLLDAVRQLGVKPEAIWLTHGHIDHAGGAAALARALTVPIIGPHADDAFLLASLPEKGREYGIPDAEAVTPNRWLVEGDVLELGAIVFSVRHVPGHTPGHVVFVQEAARFALVGDTLFAGSVGRTDFPYGDGPLLVAGIRDKLMTLGDDVTILPGHGPASTIGRERMTDPYVGDAA